MSDYTRDAEHLFETFAARHRLTYVVDRQAPVDVLWRFPIQPRLSLPIWLGFHNADQLNFGVGSFCTEMFPFPKVAEQFASILDAWVRGEARVERASPWKLVLQTCDGGEWSTVYRHMALFPAFRREPKLLQNVQAEMLAKGS